jgi:hypothetical protein
VLLTAPIAHRRPFHAVLLTCHVPLACPLIAPIPRTLPLICANPHRLAVVSGRWLQINVFGRQLSEDDKMRLNNEVKILKSLNNPHIIKCYGAWKDKEDEMNFVTELFTR